MSGMKTRFLWLIFLLLTGCASASAPNAVPPTIAQQTMAETWQVGQHVVWQLAWPNVPVNGVVTVETWRGAGGGRLEILEASAAELWGQTLIFNGDAAWLFNRFDAAPPVRQAEPRLSPITDAFSLIDQSLKLPAQSATVQEDVILQYGPAQKITLIFNKDDQLTFWLKPDLGLPVRVVLTRGANQLTLKATHAERMSTPPAGLFKPPNR
jgi:hypothetical protein